MDTTTTEAAAYARQTETKAKYIQPWNVLLHTNELCMQRWELCMLTATAKAWASEFSKEPSRTLAVEHFGIPSVLLRFDYVLKDGMLKIYEIEERPADLGLAFSTNADFAAQLIDWTRKIETAISRKISIFIAPTHRRASDDQALEKNRHTPFNAITGDLSHPAMKKDALIVRAHRHDKRYWGLERDSLSTVRDHGRKEYGIALKLWEAVQDELPFDKGFVLKPEHGSRSKGLYMYHPSGETAGFASKSSILKAVEKQKVSYVQPYHAPEQHEFLGKNGHLVRRAYFGYDPDTRGYTCLGGIWVAQKHPSNHGIHGATMGILRSDCEGKSLGI